jgi:hypothetical protein
MERRDRRQRHHRIECGQKPAHPALVEPVKENVPLFASDKMIPVIR